jgi:hypothetical protein
MRARSITRRAMSRGVAGAAALAMTIVLSGCGTSTTDAPARSAPGYRGGESTAQTAPTGKLVMIIRHGEKPQKKNDGPGIDPTGKIDDHSLTPIGWQRARALTDVFDGQGPTPPGLVKPATIYAAGANANGQGARTRETVMPLADKLGLQVNAAYGKGDEEALAQSVASQPGPTLISWQHSEIPSIAEAFGVVSPAPPSEWPDDRYDVVWTLEKTPTGWQFAQIPQMVLPGDQAMAITE